MDVEAPDGEKCEHLKIGESNIYIYIYIYRSFATTVSQLKICDFSEETLKGFEVL